MTLLESRTQHQPGKLQNMSKNECVSTPSILRVNKNRTILSSCVFSGLQAVHKRVTGFGAWVLQEVRSRAANMQVLPRFYCMKLTLQIARVEPHL